MDREVERSTRYPRQAMEAEDDWEPIDLTPTEGRALAALLERMNLRNIRPHATTDLEAFEMLKGAGKMAASLKAAGYRV